MIRTSLEKVMEAIKTKQSFVLEAGAGSGKTYTLIQALNYILENYSNDLSTSGKKIACITFTNVAKNEIIERTENNNLVVVQTIHEFLWDCVKNFQAALHEKIQELNNEYERLRKEEEKRQGYEYVENLDEVIKTKMIEYSPIGRSNFSNGELGHDDIILISYYMFRDYPSLSNVIADKYPYLFIDEYQDTEEKTILSLLDYHLKLQQGKIVLGFFGDSMQKIYDKGIGEIPSKYYKDGNEDKLLVFITKDENYRCSIAIVDLLNKIREDLVQTPAGSNKEIQGKASFLYGSSNYEDFFKHLEVCGWNFEDLNTKVLFLTHTGIAKKLEYENLLKIYTARYGQYGRDRLFKKEERFSDFFLGDKGVEKVCHHYELEEYGEVIDLLQKVGYRLTYHKDKEAIKKIFDELNTLKTNRKVSDVYNFIREKNILIIPDKISEFEKYINQKEIEEENVEKQKQDKAFYDNLMKVEYKEFINVYDFIENRTIFSTKHGTKGDEFENVLAIIDDNAWKQSYNFEEMFSNESKYSDRLQRTLNLFYVCCSRAKKNLAVATISNMNSTAMITIKRWFGEENVIEVKNI